MLGLKFRVVLVALLLLSLTPAYAGGDTWIEVRSQHFSVITDGGERSAREVLKRFEQMRASFQVLFQKVNVNAPVPLQIVALKNTKELKQFSPIWKGKAVELAGYFQPGDDRNYIALDLSTEGWGVVFHEYAHMLINANLPPTPLWVDEGYADFFSTIRISGKDVEFGTVPPGHAQILQEAQWMRCVDLFSVQHDSREYNETNNRRHVFYAQSWLTIHYFMTRHKMAQLARYLDLTGKNHMPVPLAIQQAFGMTPEQFDKKIYEYFHGPGEFFRAPAPADAEGLPYQARTMGTLEKDAVLADLKFHIRDHQAEGVEEFKRVVAADPNNALANRGLGYAYLRGQEFEKAAPYLRKASEAGSNDPRLHYFMAMLLGRSSSGMVAVDHDKAEEMRAELLKAIQLDPEYADAYNMLAIVDSTTGDNDAAIQHVQKAIQLNSRNELYSANLAGYLLHAEKWDEATALLQQLKNSSNPGVVMMAERNLDSLEQMKRWKAQGATSSRRIVVVEDNEQDAPPPPPAAGKIGFLKGKLLHVDCSNEPTAMLEVKVGSKLWHLRATDRSKLVLIGAGTFSCEWKDKTVAANYSEIGENAGDLLSLELQ